MLWREGQKRRYHAVKGTLTNAIAAKVQKEKYLASVAAGLKVEDPVGRSARLTVAQATDEFLSTLTGRGNTVPLYTQNLRQFQEWNSSTARKKHISTKLSANICWGLKSTAKIGGNEELTAIWKIIRVSRSFSSSSRFPFLNAIALILAGIIALRNYNESGVARGAVIALSLVFLLNAICRIAFVR